VFLSILWYLGGALVAIGALCVIRPMRWLRLPTRRRAALTAVAGALLAALTLLVGTGTRRVTDPSSLLDVVLPAFQFDEQHSIDVRATSARVYKAVLEVTPQEISGYRTLTGIRCLGRCPEGGLMNPPSRAPILTTAVATGFKKLAETPDWEFVFGAFVAAPPGVAGKPWTVETFLRLADPGFAKVAMNFRLHPLPDGTTRLYTVTRVFATDPETVRVFAAYWRTILPGSSLIRIAWLRAIKRRAER
jgi:hypothetical protein